MVDVRRLVGDLAFDAEAEPVPGVYDVGERMWRTRIAAVARERVSEVVGSLSVLAERAEDDDDEEAKLNSLIVCWARALIVRSAGVMTVFRSVFITSRVSRPGASPVALEYIRRSSTMVYAARISAFGSSFRGLRGPLGSSVVPVGIASDN